MINVFVRKDGCISMGSVVSCDGFMGDRRLRIQTHCHEDHMIDFNRSKGKQNILLAQATKDLLVAELNADLPYRDNLFVVPADGRAQKHVDTNITFFPAGHMPGAVMPMVEIPEVGNVMYTGDFSWPLNLLPKKGKVNTLIVDSTYGNPELQRNYTLDSVIEDLLECVRAELAQFGYVVFTGHRGRLQLVAQILCDQDIQGEYIFSKKALKTLDVYKEHRGFDLAAIGLEDEPLDDLLAKDGAKILFIESRDRVDILPEMRKIYLSAFMVGKQEPIKVYETMNITRVALTDHADFQGTIALIQEISPQQVICCNRAGGNSEALAQYVQKEMGIMASAEVQNKGMKWGGDA